jgi:hypothetical protein
MRAVLFFVLLLFILSGIKLPLDKTLQKRSRSSQEDKIQLIMDHKVDAQIAIFGSSVALVQFNPSVIEKAAARTCYNFRT